MTDIDLSNLFVEIPTKVGSDLRPDLRPAKPEDIMEAAMLHAEGKCPHTVIYHSPGWDYNLRYCFTCGGFISFI